MCLAWLRNIKARVEGEHGGKGPGAEAGPTWGRELAAALSEVWSR